MRFNTHSQTTKDGAYHERTYHGAIDAFLVYYPEMETFYWIDNPSINWAEAYEFGGKIPDSVTPYNEGH